MPPGGPVAGRSGAGEGCLTVPAAGFGEVLRGVWFTPGTGG